MPPGVQVVLVLEQHSPVAHESPGVVDGLALCFAHDAALDARGQLYEGNGDDAALDLADHHLEVRLCGAQGVLDFRGVGLIFDHLLKGHGEFLEV